MERLREKSAEESLQERRKIR